jgi:LysM repeat protein
MEKRSSAAPRIAAAIALIAAVVVVVAVVTSVSSEDSSPTRQQGKSQPQKEKKHRTKAKTYTVESEDTLTAISHKTGIPIAEILALNPEVDPQILIAGQTLKLR